MTIDFSVGLKATRDHSEPLADALVRVLDLSWVVHAYLTEKQLPCDGATVARLTELVLQEAQP
jgi:hypothetical protein